MMNRYLALLRGVNVAGQKKIKMAKLRTAIMNLGYSNVKSYIQSGNLIFSCPEKSNKKITDQIIATIRNEFDFDVPCLVYTVEEFEDILLNNPHRQDKNKEKERLYFTLLFRKPTRENIKKISTFDFPPEEFALNGKCVYFYSPLGYGRAKMNNNFFEQKLKVPATTRNWKTMNKLLDMMKSM